MVCRPATLARAAAPLALLCGFAAFPLGGCGGNGDRAADREAERALESTARYTVRGRVAMLPEEGKPTSEFRVFHEAIPDFKSNFNEPPTGMNAMVMPFDPAPEGALEGLSVGDPVQVTFEVKYDPETGALVGWSTTGVEALPADTVLDLPEARDEH